MDTTMGFTPLEGLVLSTRSGSVDPGILIFLMRQHGVDADQIGDMLNKQDNDINWLDWNQLRASQDVSGSSKR